MGDHQVNFVFEGKNVSVGMFCRTRSREGVPWTIWNTVEVGGVKYRKTYRGNLWERMVFKKQEGYHCGHHSVTGHYYFRKVSSTKIISLLDRIIDTPEVKSYDWGEDK